MALLQTHTLWSSPQWYPLSLLIMTKSVTLYRTASVELAVLPQMLICRGSELALGWSRMNVKELNIHLGDVLKTTKLNTLKAWILWCVIF